MPLSWKLGPRARSLASSRRNDVVEGLVEVARDSDFRNLKRELEKIGAHVYASAGSRTTGFIRVDVPTRRLNAVAKVTDVLYVEADDRLR